MKIVFACDHAGLEMKEYLKGVVTSLGYEVEDVGAHEFVPDDDYPQYIALAAQAVSEDPENTVAVVLGGSGQGEAIVANRFPRVRAVVYVGDAKTKDENQLDMLALTREHNDANVLSLGARFLSTGEAESAVRRWLETPFSHDERHKRRINQIESLSGKE